MTNLEKYSSNLVIGYLISTQVWRTNSSWQQEAAENNSELF